MNENKIYGLSSQQAEESRRLHGSNDLTQRDRKSFFDYLKESLKDTWLEILMVALALELVFYGIGRIWPTLGSDDWYSAVAIAVAIVVVSVLNATINYRQDCGAQALQKEASQIVCKVYRDFNLVELPIAEIVVGDAVYLQAGDKIPADGILLEGSLKVDQSALNGESREAEKIVLGNNPIPDNSDIFTKLKCFRGSVVTSESAIMEVCAVGDNTVLGGINEAVQEKDDTLTPSEEKLKRLAKNIGIFGYCGGSVAAILNFVLGIINADSYTVGSIAYLLLSSIILCVTIIVMAVPEGLPLMNTMVQGLNIGKMLKAHIYVKNPKSIESAGYLTHLFTDKTGTLTEGKMRVVNVITGDAEVHKTYDELSDAIKHDIMFGAGANNEATLSNEGKAIGSNDTDRAILTYLVDNEVVINQSQIAERQSFDSRVKYAAVTTVDGVKYIKGAPDIIMEGCTAYVTNDGTTCPFTKEIHSQLVKEWNNQTEHAMRVLAVVKEVSGERIFVSLLSIRDDVRIDVKGSVKKLHRAGVKVTMVTGDVKATAIAIAKEAGLITSSDDICLTHEELAQMSDEELREVLPSLKVVSRAVPDDKKRLIEVGQSIGEVVGMTGDGVNDAAALHKANVGFAMGSGTEVAKEAGDIIILNDSLVSIADAVMYGRTMSKSVKKFIIFQLTVNVSTMFTAILGPVLGWSEVFTIIQILWINLIMDTLAAIAFGTEPARESYMDEQPVPRTADILNKYLISAIGTGGIFITVLCLSILKNVAGIWNLIGSSDANTIQTFMFGTFILAVLWNGFNARTDSMNLFEHITENHNFILVIGLVAIFQVFICQIGGKVFGTVPLSLVNWVVIAGISFLIIPVDLMRKVVVRNRGIME